MPFDGSPSEFSYSKLFAVVLLAVAGGNLLSTWITARVVESQLQTVASEASARLKQEVARGQQSAAAAAAQREREAAAQAAQVQELRRADKVGVKLSQACAEWTKANQELRSYTTQAEQEKACARLNAYIQTGELPR